MTAVGYDLSEAAIMEHGYVSGGIIRACASLAKMNGIQTAVRGAEKIPIDPEFGDLLSAFKAEAFISLRRARKLPEAQIEEFRQHLDRRRKTSAVFGHIMRHGRTAAIRYLQKRAASREDPTETERLIEVAGTMPPEQIREPGIETFIDRLPPLQAEAIRLKYGLGDGVERSFTDLAAILNAGGIRYLGEYRWTRNNASELVREAIEALRGMDGIEQLQGRC